jgi:hypothetical protein
MGGIAGATGEQGRRQRERTQGEKVRCFHRQPNFVAPLNKILVDVSNKCLNLMFET